MIALQLRIPHYIREAGEFGRKVVAEKNMQGSFEY